MTSEGDWMKVRTLPDGRRVEFVGAAWAPDEGDEPPGTIRVGVTYLMDGEVGYQTVLMTAAEVEAAYEAWDR